MLEIINPPLFRGLRKPWAALAANAALLAHVYTLSPLRGLKNSVGAQPWAALAANAASLAHVYTLPPLWGLKSLIPLRSVGCVRR